MEFCERKPKDFLNAEVKREPEDDFNDETISDAMVETGEYESVKFEYNSYEEASESRQFNREFDEEDDPNDALLTNIPYHHNPEQLNVVQKFFLHNQKNIPRFAVRAENDGIGPIRKRGRPRKYELPDYDPRGNLIQRSSMEHTPGRDIENSGEARSTPVQELKPHCDRCAACTRIQIRKEMKFVSSTEERFMIFIGCVLHGDLTVEEAKLRLNSASQHKYICRSHFTDTVNAICKSLDIEHTDKICSCSPQLMKNVMAIVNEFYPLESRRFKIMFTIFAKRNKYITDNTNSDDDSMKYSNYNERIQRPLKPPSVFCSICSKSIDRRKTKQLSVYEEKVILMTAWLLRDIFTTQQATDFISTSKLHFVCNHHFSDITNGIFDFLGIKTYNEIVKCSPEKVKMLLVTVNTIDQSMRPERFISSFQKFVRLNLKRSKQ